MQSKLGTPGRYSGKCSCQASSGYKGWVQPGVGGGGGMRWVRDGGGWEGRRGEIVFNC